MQHRGVELFVYQFLEDLHTTPFDGGRTLSRKRAKEVGDAIIDFPGFFFHSVIES